MKKLIETWTFEKVRFFSIDNGNGFHIFNENGDNHGCWMKVEKFRKYQSEKDAMAKPIGTISRIDLVHGN